MRCDYCDGSGYGDDGDFCGQCAGGGTVDWWKSKAYRNNPSQIPKEKVDREKGYAELGILCGVLSGLYAFLLTANFYLSLSVCVGVMVVSTAIIRFIGKNFLVLAVVGYVIFQFIT